jgi:hypothetical protein
VTIAVWPLDGRDQEFEALLAVIEGGGSVVVVGGVGVGKSFLVANAMSRARQLGVRTVEVRATRSMATIPFGPFADWAPEVTGSATGERLQVLQGIAGALGRTDGGDGPVVVAVDEAHLLDDGSAALVYYLAAHTTVGVVVAVGSGERRPDAIRALWKETLAERIELHPLSRSKAAELLSRVLGGHMAHAAERRLWRLTKGTPLYLREVVRAAIDAGVLVSRNDVWRWQGKLAGRERLAESVRDRLSDKGIEARRALEWVAIADPLPVELAGQLSCLTLLTEAARQGLGGSEEVSFGERERGLSRGRGRLKTVRRNGVRCRSRTDVTSKCGVDGEQPLDVERGGGEPLLEEDLAGAAVARLAHSVSLALGQLPFDDRPSSQLSFDRWPRLVSRARPAGGPRGS